MQASMQHNKCGYYQIAYQFHVRPGTDIWISFGIQHNLVSEYIWHVKLGPLRHDIPFELELIVSMEK